MNTRAPRLVRTGATAATLALCGILCACVTEGETARKPKLEVPWPHDNPPADFESLADDLMAFQGATGSLPLDLRQLDRARLSAGGPYAGRAYAYHPSGIGILRDGWCVMAVNDRILPGEEGRLWAILRPPVRIQDMPTLQVAQVTLAELAQAGEMAGKKDGGKAKK